MDTFVWIVAVKVKAQCASGNLDAAMYQEIMPRPNVLI